MKSRDESHPTSSSLLVSNQFDKPFSFFTFTDISTTTTSCEPPTQRYWYHIKSRTMELLCCHYFEVFIFVCILTRALSFHVDPSISGLSTRARRGISRRPKIESPLSSRFVYDDHISARTLHVMHSTTSESRLSDSPSATSSDGILGKVVFVLPHNANQVVSKFGSYSPYGRLAEKSSAVS